MKLNITLDGILFEVSYHSTDNPAGHIIDNVSVLPECDLRARSKFGPCAYGDHVAAQSAKIVDSLISNWYVDNVNRIEAEFYKEMENNDR